MKFINTNYEIPYYNFALEEYLLTEAPEDDYVFFYIHKPSIIVGKFQNTIEEINKEFVDSQNIIIARRLSGGGAVYHDYGNLNFSFVHKADKNDVNNFSKFTKPVIDALNSLGVNAELSGRNDIVIDDKKISGNAQCFKNGRLLHHGTLLYNADMSNLTQALKVKDIKMKSKGIKSVRSRVANISDYLDKPMEIHAFKKYLFESFKKSKNIEELILDNNTVAKIESSALNQFATWDWNWGNSPKYEFEKIEKFPCGLINVKMNIEKGKIFECKIYGDFFTSENIENIENVLTGSFIRKDSILKSLENINLNLYFNGLSNEDFANFLIDQ
jgi:lipoate-protein ligase A